MKNAIVIFLLAAYLPQWCFSQTAPAHSKLYFASKEVSRVSIDSVYRYQVVVRDSINKQFSFAIQNAPAWISFNGATHTLAGKPNKAGQFAIHIIAFNADTAISQQYMLTVYNNKTTNILCLGNSITNGTSKYNSYRRYLWQLLHKANYNIDFIGSWSGHHMGGAVPNPDFDMDHDGHSGWTAADILNPPDWDKQRGNIHQWLQMYTPDIVLMELGTNEVFQCVAVEDALKNIDVIIDSLRNKNKKVKIYMAQIPPLGQQWAPKKLCGNDTSYAQRVLLFNKAIKQFAIKKSNTISPVTLVDQYTGVNPAKDMYDDIHQNDSGEKIMAQRWFNAIKGGLVRIR